MLALKLLLLLLVFLGLSCDNLANDAREIQRVVRRLVAHAKCKKTSKMPHNEIEVSVPGTLDQSPLDSLSHSLSYWLSLPRPLTLIEMSV